jgi:hypothetical protein
VAVKSAPEIRVLTPAVTNIENSQEISFRSAPWPKFAMASLNTTFEGR